MKQTSSVLCAQCLSTLDATGGCTACGWTPSADRGWGPWLAGAAFGGVCGALLGAAATWWVLGSYGGLLRDAGEPPRQEVTAGTAERPGAPPQPTASGPPPPAPLPTIELRRGEQPVFAAQLRDPANPRVVAYLPLTEVLQADALRDRQGGIPLVLATDATFGFALLVGITPSPGSVSLPPAPSASGPGSTLWRPDSKDPLAVVAIEPTPPHALRMDSDVDAGVVLIDAAGRAAAFTVGGARALNIAPAVAWLARAGPPRPFLEVQRELRAQADPLQRLEDARARLDRADSTDGIRAAIEELEMGCAAARDPQTILAFDQAVRTAHRRLVQKLVASGHALEGYAHLRKMLDRFVGDVDWLAEGVTTAAAAAELHAAADLWLELRSRDRERSESLARPLGDSIRDAGEAATRRDAAAASDLLVRGVELWPDRADLRIAYADALLAAGQTFAAVDQARIASAQDARFWGRFEAIARRADARRPAAVEVPFDPESHVVQARCSLDGAPLDLVVDTGATITVVPSALASRGRTSKRRLSVQTAGGTVEGNLVRFQELRIGELTVRNVQAVALDLPGPLAGKGLLGMNVLRRLDVRIDSARGVLVLERSSTR